MNDMASLSRRIEALERKNGLLWMTALLGIVSVALVVGMSCSRDRSSVEAYKFVLLDQNNNQRVVQQVLQGNAVVGFMSSSGTMRMALVDEPTGPHLSFNDRNGKRRADLALTNTGPQLVFNDAQGNPRGTFAVDDQAAYILMTRSGTPEAEFGADSRGPALKLFDSLGNHRIGLSIPADRNEPVLFFGDPDARPRVVLGVNEAKSFMELINKRGEGVTSSSR